MSQVIWVTKEDWQKESNSFVFEASDKQMYVEDVLFLRSEKTGIVKRFNYVSTDKTPDGEEIAGWRYVSEDGKFKLLVIND